MGHKFFRLIVLVALFITACNQPERSSVEYGYYVHSKYAMDGYKVILIQQQGESIRQIRYRGRLFHFEETPDGIFPDTSLYGVMPPDDRFTFHRLGPFSRTRYDVDTLSMGNLYFDLEFPLRESIIYSEDDRRLPDCYMIVGMGKDTVFNGIMHVDNYIHYRFSSSDTSINNEFFDFFVDSDKWLLAQYSHYPNSKILAYDEVPYHIKIKRVRQVSNGYFDSLWVKAKDRDFTFIPCDEEVEE